MATRQIPWARVLVEGVVIGASILLAFGIDALWEGRQERSSERQILVDLSEEFEGHRTDLDRLVGRTELKRSAGEDLLAWMLRKQEYSIPQLDSLWSEVVTITGFQPATGAHDAVISAGRLDLIENVELRNRVAGRAHEVDEVLTREAGVSAIVQPSLVPTLVAHGAPLSRFLAARYEWSAPVPGEADANADYGRVRDSKEIEGIVAYRYAWTTGLRSDYRAALDFVENILNVLATELKS